MSGIAFTTIPLSGSVSGDIDLSKQTIFAIAIPLVTSSDLFFRSSFDTTSANFLRMLDTRAPGSGDLRIATGPGSRMVAFPAEVTFPSYARLEFGVPQTSVVSLTLLLIARH